MPVQNLQVGEITFSGGINNTDPESEIADNEFVEGENKELYGSDLRDRGGSAKLNSTALGAYYCTGIFDVPIAGVHYLMTMYSDGKIYTETSSTRTERGSGFSTGANVRWSVSILQDSGGTPYACLFNGVNAPQKWNPAQNAGNVNAISGTVTQTAPISVIFGDRLWYFKSLKGYWSALLDCTTGVEATNLHKYPDDGSEEIIGAFVYKGSLFVSTQSNMHRTDYSGDATLPFTHEGEFVVRGHGYYHNSVAEINGYIYALGSDGHFYIFDGVNETPIDGKIKAYVDDITASRRKYCWALYDPNNKEYLITLDLTSASYNDTILVANVEMGTLTPRWNTKWTSLKLNCLTLFDSSGTKIVYGGTSSNDGFVYKVNYGSDDSGSAIAAWVKTKQYTWGTSMLEKYFRYFQIVFSSLLTTFSTTFEVIESGNTYTVSLTTSGDYLCDDTVRSDDFWLGDDTDLGSYLVAETSVARDFVNMFNERDYSFQAEIRSSGVSDTAKIRRILVGWQPQKLW